MAARFAGVRSPLFARRAPCDQSLCGGWGGWYPPATSVLLTPSSTRGTRLVQREGAPLSMVDLQTEQDERLIVAIAEGERDALGELYDRFSPALLGVALRMLGSTREAEDVVQDVFLEAWQRARHYDRSRGTVRTWLMLRL